MEHRSGEDARNVEHRENNSPEQENKINKGQDIEPQAEEWNPRHSELPNEEEHLKK